MKPSELIILLMPIISLYVLVKYRNSFCKHKIIYFVCVVYASIVAAGIYVPFAEWVSSHKTLTEKIVVYDEYGKPVSGVVILVGHLYTVACIPGWKEYLYYEYSCETDSLGCAKLVQVTKKIPFRILPFFVIEDVTCGASLYKHGYCLKIVNIENDKYITKVKLSKPINIDELLYSFDRYKYHNINCKSVSHDQNLKKSYSVVINGMLAELYRSNSKKYNELLTSLEHNIEMINRCGGK